MSTVNIALDEDERFPTYSFGDRGSVRADVDTETLDRWRVAIEAYDAVQDEIGEVYKAARLAAQRERAIVAAERAVADAQAKLDGLRNG